MVDLLESIAAGTAVAVADSGDDIAYVPVPPDVIHALQDELSLSPAPAHLDLSTLEHKVMMMADATLSRLTKDCDVALTHMEKIWQGTLQAMALPLPVPPPYDGLLHVRSPSGFPMAFGVRGATQEEFLTRLKGLLEFCAQAGFTPGGI